MNHADMNHAELIGLVIETSVAMSAATLLVLILRRPLRRWFGPGAAYAAWASVPIAALAAALPSMPNAYVAQMPALTVAVPIRLVGEDASPFVEHLADLPTWTITAWAIGALLMASLLLLRQWRFQRGLGALQPRADGSYQAQHDAGLPAAMGLWRPKIVVPADFDTRYSDEQRRLMQAHEREHIVRGDLWANAIAALLRCLFWFNPLSHALIEKFRHDQELACDRRVMRAFPGSRRSYGEAMLKTLLAPSPAPLSCHWGSTHPLKERILMLKTQDVSARRWAIGGVAVALLSLVTGFGAWAAQPQWAAAAVSAAAAPDAAEKAPGYASMTAPAYPKYSNGGGRVVLLIEVGTDGRPLQVKVHRSSGFIELDNSTLEAALDWRFNPRLQHGKPVVSWVQVPVDFVANASAAATDSAATGDLLAQGGVTALEALRVAR